jgi:hypothetical protein
MFILAAKVRVEQGNEKCKMGKVPEVHKFQSSQVPGFASSEPARSSEDV